jgi:predicted NBD/HSP70 family sugar kinase
MLTKRFFILYSRNTNSARCQHLSIGRGWFNGRQRIMLSFRSETEATVLQVLSDGAPRSRAELSREMGVTRSTVGAPTARLLDLGILRFADPAEPQPAEGTRRFGRPGERLELTPYFCFFVGVEITFGTIRVALMNLLGEVVEFRDLRMSPTEQTPEAVMATVEREVTDLIGRRSDVAGLAVSVPGVVTDEGMVLRAPTLRWRDVPLTTHLQATFSDIDLLQVCNDASLYAAAFSSRFPDRLGKNAIVAWLDTGIGGGLVTNGMVVSGNSGLAGEIGHMLSSVGNKTGIQRLEDIAGSWALLSRNAELGGKARTISDLLDEHRAGHPATIEAFADWSQAIAEALTNMAGLTDPGVMLFSGPMAAVLQYMEAETFEAYSSMLQYGTPPAQWRIQPSDEKTLVKSGAVLLRQAFLSYREAIGTRTLRSSKRTEMT